MIERLEFFSLGENFKIKKFIIKDKKQTVVIARVYMIQ